MKHNKLKTHALKSDIVENAMFVGDYDFPLLKHTNSIPNTLVPFDNINRATPENWIHFYIDDYKFERVWNNPNRYINVLKKYSGIIGFDFSVCIDMPFAQQIWNMYRNRALSHYLQEAGVNVIPNVQWGDESTYSFCFDGIPTESTVSISTNGTIYGGYERYIFKKGLSKMIEVLKPKTVLNYSNMPNDIFDTFTNTKTKFIQFDNYNDIIRNRCRCNG